MENHTMDTGNYKKFALMLALSFLIMYAVMFLNVAETDHIYLSLSRTYMALIMVSPMAILMLLMMPMMYQHKKLNRLIMVSPLLVFVLALTFLRKQIPVNDQQYMKAMIPHHSSAIMVSKNADLKDPELKKLSEDIIKAQEKEIRQMKHILQRLNN